MGRPRKQLSEKVVPVPVTAERLMALYDYDSDTGIFTRKTNHGGEWSGTSPTYVTEDGYLRFSVGGILYRAHRLAWLYVHGRFPSGAIDHIDGDRLNNRIANLRECTLSENAQNAPRHARADSKHGFRGVSFQSQKGKWQARIMVNGRSKSCGLFNTPEEAHEAYLKAKQEHHPFQNQERSAEAFRAP